MNVHAQAHTLSPLVGFGMGDLGSSYFSPLLAEPLSAWVPLVVAAAADSCFAGFPVVCR